MLIQNRLEQDFAFGLVGNGYQSGGLGTKKIGGWLQEDFSGFVNIFRWFGQILDSLDVDMDNALDLVGSLTIWFWIVESFVDKLESGWDLLWDLMWKNLIEFHDIMLLALMLILQLVS